MAIKVGDAVLFIGTDTSGLTKGLALAQTALKGFGSAATKAGAALTVGGAALTAGFAIAVKAASEYEQAITNAAVVTGKVGDELKVAKKSIDELAATLGQTTVFTARQAADALGILARKGFDVANSSVKEMQPFLDLASATMSDLTFTTDVATSTLKAFGIATEDVSRVADVFVKAANTSALNMQTLGEAMKFVAPVARAAGVDLEQTVAALAKLAEKGTVASIAGSGLRRVFVELLGPGAIFRDTLKRIGVDVADISLKNNTLAEVLKTLKDAQFTTADAMDVFGQRAGPIIEQLAELSEQGEKASKKIEGIRSSLKKGVPDSLALSNLAAFTKSLRNIGGVAGRTAQEQLNTLRGQWTLLKSAVESVVIQIGQALIPILTTFAKKTTEVVRDLGKWVKNNKEVVAQVLQWAAALGVAALAIGPILFALPAVIAGMFQLGTIGAPITVALTAVFKKISDLINEAIKDPEKFFDDMRDIIEGFIKDSVRVFNKWKDDIKEILRSVELAFDIAVLEIEAEYLRLSALIVKANKDIQREFNDQIDAIKDWAKEHEALAIKVAAVTGALIFLSPVLRLFANAVKVARFAWAAFSSPIGLFLAVGGAGFLLTRWLGNLADEKFPRVSAAVSALSTDFQRFLNMLNRVNEALLTMFQRMGRAFQRAFAPRDPFALPSLQDVEREQFSPFLRPAGIARSPIKPESKSGGGGAGSNISMTFNINGAGGNPTDIANSIADIILQLNQDGQLTRGALA